MAAEARAAKGGDESKGLAPSLSLRFLRLAFKISEDYNWEVFFRAQVVVFGFVCAQDARARGGVGCDACRAEGGPRAVSAWAVPPLLEQRDSKKRERRVVTDDPQQHNLPMRACVGADAC